MDIDKTPPKVMRPEWIVHWSTSAKRLEGVKQGKAIITKAKKFNERDLVRYNENTQDWTILPIPGYNKTSYTVKPEDGHFTCNCQFYNTVSKNWEHPSCSHIQAVKFWLEIKRWNK